MTRLRVLVVEDSSTIRGYLVNVLRSAPDMEVVGEASRGEDAITMCGQLRPDVITMDMMLNGMNGLLATESIMAFTPTPILIVSASVNRGEAFRTYDALAAGAVDVLDKPNATTSPAEWEQGFLSTLRIVARIKVITHPRGRLRPAAVLKEKEGNLARGLSGAEKLRLVTLGASTGGPAVIAQILAALPADYPLPILVVLHISELFAFAFAEWLASQISLPVRLAVDLELLPSRGTPGVLIAPAGKHMIVEGGRIRLTRTPERNSCRPSIDELFESVAREVGEGAVMALLTGMGKDGADGLLAGARVGAQTLAQNEESSVIFGMPGEAIRLGAAKKVLPPAAIAAHLVALTASGKAVTQ